MDRNLYDLRPDEAEDLAPVSRSLTEALAALEADHEFLTRGDVMPLDLIEAYVEVKRRECDEVEPPRTRSSLSSIWGCRPLRRQNSVSGRGQRAHRGDSGHKVVKLQRVGLERAHPADDGGRAPRPAIPASPVSP